MLSLVTFDRNLTTNDSSNDYLKFLLDEGFSSGGGGLPLDRIRILGRLRPVLAPLMLGHSSTICASR